MLESIFANHAVSVPTAETTLEIKIGMDRTVVRATGSLFHVLDVTEQLCWLTSASRISSDGAWSRCTPFITDEPELKTITVDVINSRFSEMRPTASDRCWMSIIGAAHIVDGFPIRRRSNNEPGLELTLDAMVAFAKDVRANTFESKLVIKSWSTLFVAMKQTQSSTVWHGIVKQECERGRISFLATERLVPQPGLDAACLKSERHFLGWSINTTQEVGMRRHVILDL